MIPGGDKYVWLVWALAFLIPWVALYAAFPGQRRIMRSSRQTCQGTEVIAAST